MKKFSTAVLFLSLIISQSYAQSTADVFDPAVPITWLGVDFTKAKIVGDRERLSTESDVVKLMTSINELMKAEADKYDVAKAMKRKSAEVDLDVTTDHNVGLDINEMFTEGDADVTVSDIQGIVKDYDFNDHTGLGVMVNFISLNKDKEQGIVYFTVINMGSKEVLLTERYALKPGGLSIRNFWARIVFDMLEKIRTKDFEAWKKKGY